MVFKIENDETQLHIVKMMMASKVRKSVIITLNLNRYGYYSGKIYFANDIQMYARYYIPYLSETDSLLISTKKDLMERENKIPPVFFGDTLGYVSKDTRDGAIFIIKKFYTTEMTYQAIVINRIKHLRSVKRMVSFLKIFQGMKEGDILSKISDPDIQIKLRKIKGIKLVRTEDIFIEWSKMKSIFEFEIQLSKITKSLLNFISVKLIANIISSERKSSSPYIERFKRSPLNYIVHPLVYNKAIGSLVKMKEIIEAIDSTITLTPRQKMQGLFFAALRQMKDLGWTKVPIEKFNDVLRDHGIDPPDKWPLFKDGWPIYYNPIIYLRDFVAFKSHLDMYREIKEYLTLTITEVKRIPLLTVETEKILTPAQKKSVDNLRDYPVSILTGGPGTGKTTVLKYLAKAADSVGYKILFLAPTGKAAKRIMDITSEKGYTIHKALNYPLTDPRTLSIKGSVPDIIVVDECSMLDLGLQWAVIMAAKRFSAKLLLVGDPDQLPPIGYGEPFSDLIASGSIPVTLLTKIHRQEEGSGILKIATAIRTMKYPETIEYKDFIWGTVKSLKTVFNVAQKIPKDKYKHIILSHRNKDVDTLNNLYQRLNKEMMIRMGCRSLKIGDPIIHLVNDYDLGRFNGETGKVVSFGKDPSGNNTVFIKFPDGSLTEYRKEDSTKIKLAYSLTIHKAQGSEYDIVILYLPELYYYLTRELIYTAITRATKSVIVMSGFTAKEWWSMAKTERGSRRTLLEEF